MHCSQHARCSLGIGLQATFMVLVIGEGHWWCQICLPVSGRKERKINFQVPKSSVKKIATFFRLRLQIPAFSRFRNRSVFGTLSLREWGINEQSRPKNQKQELKWIPNQSQTNPKGVSTEFEWRLALILNWFKGHFHHQPQWHPKSHW